MDAVEKAIIEEQPRLDYFAKDDNRDRHTAACMKCLRDCTVPLFTKKRENTEWVKRRIKEKQDLLQQLRAANYANSQDGDEAPHIAECRKRVKQLQKQLEDHHKFTQKVNSYAIEKDII